MKLIIIFHKGLSWTEGINKFSSMSSAEKKSYFGRIQHDKKEFKSQKEYELIMKDIKSLPETVDWRTKGNSKKAVLGKNIFAIAIYGHIMSTF